MNRDPLRRDLAQEEALGNIIADADPPIYLNPSGEGEEVDRREVEAAGSGDGEANNSGDGEADSSDDGEAGEVYI